jgi:cyclopropane fatty-acyl-phospholipid synthase-like methyltransferase
MINEAPLIGKNGEFISETVEHAFCKDLNNFLCDSLKGKSIMDLGCGSASYLTELKKIGCTVQGYDGNPYTEKLTNGLGKVADLAQIQDFEVFDWVLSFEAGEHIPKEYEDNFITNLTKHAREGVILSWAIEGQPGEGHINCQNNDYIIYQMYKKGFICDYFKTNEVREITPLWWFQNNLLVFYKINNPL